MKSIYRGIAEMMRRAEPAACFAFEFWDGETLEIGDGCSPKVVLRLKSERGAEEIIRNKFYGFGEAYMSGDIEVEGELPELLRLGLIIQFDGNGPSVARKLRLLPSILATRGIKSASRQNVSRHYDLGNDFYALFLDKTMTYSCAYFKNDNDSLDQAQLNKYEHIARKLALRPDEALVDIGCGWGGMLIYAAQNYGVKGLGNTLSEEQYNFADRRIKDLGLQDRIEVVLKDYRDLTGKFDKFVSIGMFEHVGKGFIPVYMKKVRELLKDGGVGLLHTIGKDVERSTDLWVLEHIFPGGYLPSLSEIALNMGRAAFSVLDVENLRLHYARTLDNWAANFERGAGKVREMFGEQFVRMWRLYLNASAAGFRYGGTRLFQVLFSKGLTDRLPITRDYIYR